mmetsp:Transcript_23380/g.61182  ORF Transcript_23380/g.61182 Transcript_23380/m.61182 type:complete len:452 (-) Transcript_23380:179-1534(-)|eukprot:CAMPEP_0182947200 /NCGR_PEP_ID=MMETSP0105_2-20130417/58188_1 /TAXON_ID=81532 ORGANISM="Acanthoeca-like sp., Strain 10tr" /NCGR_SAMPLE_ID=MMETSP0105_2 /ASSEMBLY_ACC=CAM_ASM_000205 /LENGTH=451 /DNA_ID=CAMNT_0025087393 /DNA_START=283 /DNA_END=1638 /DNA_ORIENTATION=-
MGEWHEAPIPVEAEWEAEWEALGGARGDSHTHTHTKADGVEVSDDFVDFTSVDRTQGLDRPSATDLLELVSKCTASHASGARPRSPSRAPRGGRSGPTHPCPTCHVREDDSGVHGMCFVCGAFVCGPCVTDGRASICPTCGCEPSGDPVANYGLLKLLVAALPGGGFGTVAHSQRLPRHAAIAWSNLGRMHEMGAGTGCPPDVVAAVALYRKAAEAGHGPAAFYLGRVLHSGAKGVARRRERAKALFARAERSGHPVAQYNIAQMYVTGRGVRRDIRRAARLYSLSAAQGLADAQVHLAHLHRTGKGGVKCDLDKALQLGRRAAAQGHPEGRALVHQLVGGGSADSGTAVGSKGAKGAPAPAPPGGTARPKALRALSAPFCRQSLSRRKLGLVAARDRGGEQKKREWAYQLGTLGCSVGLAQPYPARRQTEIGSRLSVHTAPSTASSIAQV